MDILLSRVTQHAVNYAIRSGVTIATSYTIKQCGRLIQQAPKTQEREEIVRLQLGLESKIRIISPAIDMIELISARGHTSLESAVALTKDIRLGIQNLGTQLRVAAEEQDLIQRKSKRARGREEAEHALQHIIKEMKLLIDKIDDAVPLVNLAITTSGVNLSTKLSTNVSPSRLLQASTFLTAADGAYTMGPGRRVQVGPTFVVSLYMLFAGHASRAIDETGVRDTTWKEVLHKAHVKLVRVPLDQCSQQAEATDTDEPAAFRDSVRSAEFAYQLSIVEDLDDDRVHEGGDEAGPFDGVRAAGIRDVVPIHEISKLFYADTGKILNIRGDDEDNTPVLLLKRDVNAPPPRRMLISTPQSRSAVHDSVIDENHPATEVPTELSGKTKWRLPVDLDPEWMALEVFTTAEESEDDRSDDESTMKRASGSSLNGLFSSLSFREQSSSPALPQQVIAELQANSRGDAGIKTSLSLLEMLIKLTALQQFRQESHLAIEDELLNFFLEESATAGAGGDKNRRQRLRQHAIKKVGFDPYDESPIRRRGETYIQAATAGGSVQSSPPSISLEEHHGNGTVTPLRGSIDALRHSPRSYLDAPILKHSTPFLFPTAGDLVHRSPSPLSLDDKPVEGTSIPDYGV